MTITWLLPISPIMVLWPLTMVYQSTNHTLTLDKLATQSRGFLMQPTYRREESDTEDINCGAKFKSETTSSFPTRHCHT